MTNKTIYIVRHGETEFNRLGIVQGGSIDAPLNDYGKLQAQALYHAYGHLPFEVVLTSALRRTHETVWPFIESGLPWEQFAEINEMNWGQFEGKPSHPEMTVIYQRIKDAWAAGNLDARLEGAESAAELGQRLSVFHQHLLSRPEKHILVCSHGRAMCGLVCLLSGLSLSEMNRFQHANTGLWRAHIEEGVLHFDLQNDTRHLQWMTDEKLASKV